MLKEKQEAEERQRLELKAKTDEATWLKEKERKDKEIADATAKLKEQEKAVEKKKKDDLKKNKKKLRKEQKKEKAAKSSESGGIMAELQEEKGTDVDIEGELSEVSKAVALQRLGEKREGKWRGMDSAVSTAEGRKRKHMTKSVSVVESGEEGTSGPSKRVKLEVAGPMEGEEEFIGNSEYFSSGFSDADFSFRMLHAVSSGLCQVFCETSLQKVQLKVDLFTLQNKEGHLFFQQGNIFFACYQL